MKTNLLILLAVIGFVACSHKEPSTLTINGAIEGGNVSNLYLYEVDNQHYAFIKLLESISVSDGKFTYTNDSLPANLYFISTENNNQNPEAIDRGTYSFLRKGDNKMIISIDSQNRMQVEIENFPLQKQLIEFTEEKQKISKTPILDSLDQLFFAARDSDNIEELIRIKTESMPYYEEAYEKETNFIATKIEEEKTSLFGLYLFYTYRFQNSSFSAPEEIAEVRKRLESYDKKAKQSIYFTKIEKRLTILENCSVGHEAPEITGLDSLNNKVRLSDFRGKYVLIDFWSSGCSWCRLETPNFRKVYDEFKNKNIVILGVSSDYKKEDWLKAIHEDKSYWTQIMMPKDEISEIFASYAIAGIPEILLVDPQGVILAKGLRGEDIYNTVAKQVK